MLKNLKIGTQIGLGFCLVVVISALMVAYAISELRSGSESFKTYRSLARASVLSGRVQANMLTASNAAKDFLNTRDEHHLKVFRERFQNARFFALEQQTAIDDPARREMNRELADSLESYGIVAEEVFSLMRRRDAVLQETLNPEGTRMRQNLTEIMVSAYQDNDSEAAYVAGRALERVLLGRLYLLKFLEDNKDADVERVRAELGSGFEQSFSEMEHAIRNPERQELLQDFSAARDTYVQAFEEIVTTIKSRNTLIAKQMDPLERSVADISEQIKLSLKKDQDTLGPRVQESKEATVRAVLIGAVIAIPLALVIALSIIRAVTNPIAELVETVGDVQASGDLALRSKIRSTDEIGIMASALNDFLASLELQAGVADNVARGILATTIELRSKSDTLGIALQRMTATLSQNAEETATRDWLGAGQSRVNDEIRGNLDKELLANRVIHCLAIHLAAQRGALFLYDEATSSLHFTAGYACGEQENDNPRFREGGGLLGQVERDRQLMLIDQVPADYFKIESGLGQATPSSLILFPLVYSDRLLGIVELASFQPFTDRHIEFLSSVQESICVALRAAQSQVELRQLLDQTKQQAIFFRVFKDATDPIVLEDLSGNVMDMNAAAENAYGWKKEELIGRPIKQIVPEDRRDQADELLRQCLAGGEVRNVEGLRVSRSGTVYDVLVTLSLLRDENDTSIAVASIAKDVTSLSQARQAAEEANRAKSDFLANMSHEIRTPMNGIMGMTELALDTELTKEQREFLTTIESSAESLLSLINDILDFSKIEAKRLELDPTDFELRERIGETLTTLAARAHGKGLELAFEVDPDVPECFFGDVHRIRQIIVNLLGNAIKFTEQGEIVLHIEMVREAGQFATLRFAVTDTGIGLPPEKLDTIFLPFEQADVSTTRKYGGTGLGLAICNQLVELMGGQMNIESQVGLGTTFSFTVELQIGEHRSAAEKMPPSGQLQGLRVLVVDDNETNRRILSKMLQNWDMVPILADSAVKGLDVLGAVDAQPIALILSDVNMPEMDGFMFAEEIHVRAGLKDTPIILLTSANRTGDSARCRELGIAAHLIKPVRQSLLFDAIATSVGGAATPEAAGVIAEVGRGEARSESSLKHLRVLLAEDNEVNQKFAVCALERAGHSVKVASNGQAAVDAWASEVFDVVLMDIQMPIMDGYLATAKIRRQEASSGRHTPIIAMTAHAMKGDREKCLDAGMDGYVTKPIKSKVMLAEISRLLSSG